MPEKRHNKQNSTLTYSNAGVNIDNGNALVEAIKPILRSTKRSGSGSEIGGFGSVFDLKSTGFSDPVLVATTDGVGTKMRFAANAAIYDSIGIDLVAMCVNDLVVQGAEPLFFLDYLATGKLKVNQAKDLVSGIAKGCKQAGVALIGGETAEMPGIYSDKDYDLAGFSVGAVERYNLLPRSDLQSGDIILGLASSGIHSNGYSLIHKIIEINDCDCYSPISFPPQNLQEKTRTLSEILLTPTRIYVKPVLETIRKTGAIKALAHITGGGLIENIPRILPNDLKAILNLSKITTDDIFTWIHKKGNVPAQEMLRTFNCGIGMIAITHEKDMDKVKKVLEQNGETVYVIGQLTKNNMDKVTIDKMPAFLS